MTPGRRIRPRADSRRLCLEGECRLSRSRPGPDAAALRLRLHCGHFLRQVTLYTGEHISAVPAPRPHCGTSSVTPVMTLCISPRRSRRGPLWEDFPLALLLGVEDLRGVLALRLHCGGICSVSPPAVFRFSRPPEAGSIEVSPYPPGPGVYRFARPPRTGSISARSRPQGSGVFRDECPLLS